MKLPEPARPSGLVVFVFQGVRVSIQVHIAGNQDLSLRSVSCCRNWRQHHFWLTWLVTGEWTALSFCGRLLTPELAAFSVVPIWSHRFEWGYFFPVAPRRSQGWPWAPSKSRRWLEEPKQSHRQTQREWLFSCNLCELEQQRVPSGTQKNIETGS